MKIGMKSSSPSPAATASDAHDECWASPRSMTKHAPPARAAEHSRDEIARPQTTSSRKSPTLKIEFQTSKSTARESALTTQFRPDEIASPKSRPDIAPHDGPDGTATKTGCRDSTGATHTSIHPKLKSQ